MAPSCPALPCMPVLTVQCRCKLHSCTNLRFENQFLRYKTFKFFRVYTLTDFLTDSVWRQEKFRPLVTWFISEYPRIDADLPMALTIAWMEDEKWISIQWLGWTILTSVNPRQSGTDTVTGWRIWGLIKQGQILWLFLLVVVQREDWTNFVIRAFSVLINSWNKIQAIIQLLIIFGPKSLQSGEFSGRIFPDPVITFILYATRCETLRTLILSNRVLRYSGPETLHSGGF